MPARKKRFLVRHNKKPKKLNLKIIFVLTFLMLFLFLLKELLTKRFWTGDDALNLVIQKGNGDVSLVVFDPVSNEITNIEIPGETQVNVSRQFGVWKLKSVWDLGKNENVGGTLLTQTIGKTFKFPVYVWSDAKGFGFLSNNPFVVLNTLFVPFETNLSFGDKFSISMFALSVKNVSRSQIDLGKTTLLKKTDLIDGTSGYIFTGLASPRLYSNFTENTFSRGGFKIMVRDGSGSPESIKVVGNLIEVMGAKVTSVMKESEADFVCKVRALDKKLAVRTSLIFGCLVEKENPSENYDMEIKLGKDFSKYY